MHKKPQPAAGPQYKAVETPGLTPPVLVSESDFGRDFHSGLSSDPRRDQKAKMLPSLLLTTGLALMSSAAPQRDNNNEASNTRFFTGNNNLDSAIAGAAIGAGASFLGNQIFNPCRGNRNSGNKGSDKNNRFLGNNGAINGLLGIIGGFIAGQVANNVQGNPCG